MDLLNPYQAQAINIDSLVINLLIGLVCAGLLSLVVKKFSRLLIDRSQFTVIFFTLIPLMVLIISVVKSSLALSLGLVGALSIVRFRTPIKEPEELIYIFLAIGVGLGLGADQATPTLVAFSFILVTLIAIGLYRPQGITKGVFLNIENSDALNSEPFIKQVGEIIESRNLTSDLRQVEVTETHASITLFTEPNSAQDAVELVQDLQKQFPSARITLIDRSRQLG